MRFIILLLIFLLLPFESSATKFVHKDTVLMTDINGITSGRLGTAVSINEGAVFTSAPEQDSQAGATYQFQINDNRQLDLVRELSPQDETPRLYGSAIVSEGDLAAISYSSDDGIEIYQRQAGNWVFSIWLEPPTIADVNVRGFGPIMDVSSDYLVVGDPRATIGTDGKVGIVMIFGRNVGGSNQWGLITSFPDPQDLEDPYFAETVAITDDLMVVGDSRNQRVFVYLRLGNTWSFHKELQPTDVAEGDQFGLSIEVEEDFIAVGTYEGNPAIDPSNAGSVHIFHRHQGGNNNFGQVTEITPSAPEYIDRFGESIRLRGGFLVVGAPGANKVFVFSHLTGLWKEEQIIEPPDGVDFFNADFGSDVDYDDGSILIGADLWNDINRERYGAIFLYEDPGIISCGAQDGIFCDSYENQ